MVGKIVGIKILLRSNGLGGNYSPGQMFASQSLNMETKYGRKYDLLGPKFGLSV